MNTGLPSKITVTETKQIELDLSEIRYAVVSTDNIVYSLFKWKDRAEAYVKKYASNWSIIDLKHPHNS